MTKQKTLKTNLKGFYFFAWELNLLRKVGFKFRGLRLRSKQEINGVSFNTYQVLREPEPIKLTTVRREILRELPYKMTAINISVE